MNKLYPLAGYVWVLGWDLMGEDPGIYCDKKSSNRSRA